MSECILWDEEEVSVWKRSKCWRTKVCSGISVEVKMFEERISVRWQRFVEGVSVEWQKFEERISVGGQNFVEGVRVERQSLKEE